MPSPADPLDPSGSSEDVLRSVKTAGLRRRRARQRRRSLGVLTAVAALVVGVVITLPQPDDVVETDRASDEAPGDVDRSTTTTRPTEVLGTVIERDPAETSAPDDAAPTPSRPTPGATAPPVTPTTAPPSPPTTISCVRSTNPACGPFRWEPAPAANQPLTLTAVDVALAPGEDTVLLVDWDDPDAPLTFSDSDIDGTLLTEPCRAELRYGPWAPPAPAGGFGTFELAYTAPAEPGIYQVMVYAATAVCDGYHPYHSDASTTITVTVG